MIKFAVILFPLVVSVLALPSCSSSKHLEDRECKRVVFDSSAVREATFDGHRLAELQTDSLSRRSVQSSRVEETDSVVMTEQVQEQVETKADGSKVETRVVNRTLKWDNKKQTKKDLSYHIDSLHRKTYVSDSIAVRMKDSIIAHLEDSLAQQSKKQVETEETWLKTLLWSIVSPLMVVILMAQFYFICKWWIRKR